MAEIVAGEKALENLRRLLRVRGTVHKAVDQEAGRAQILSTGYFSGNFDQYTEHGHRVP